jgi:tetratricopeptide (TPR) repeat protein
LKDIDHFLLVIAFGVLIVISVVPCPSYAVDSDADRQFSFAESLFTEGDYFRAISEFKRFIHYHPLDVRSEKAFFKVAESYYLAKRWTEAAAAIDSFITRYPNSPLVVDALWIRGMCEKNLNRREEALATFDKIMRAYRGESRNRALYQSAIIYVEMEQWDRARVMFSRVEVGSFLYPASTHWSKGLEGIKDLPSKSPAVAGSLAAVLPGAGHVYTERYRDGLVAFLLNASFIVAAVELFRHDNNVAGGIMTFFEIGWYSGNIYSAVSSAHKFNKNIKGDYLKDMKEKSGFSFFHDPARSSTYVMYNFEY